MPGDDYSSERYRKEFLEEEEVHRAALAAALDIRKFEIDLYWKRAGYFWTFIAAALAGYVAVLSSSAEDKSDSLVLLSCLGVVFSFGWFVVNKGSKFWQENWEHHVDLLEETVNGPLYKVVLAKSQPTSLRDSVIEFMTGPAHYSVSRVNQLISLFVTAVWVVLLLRSLNLRLWAPINWYYVVLVGLTLLVCAAFLGFGLSQTGDYRYVAKKREASAESDA